MSERLPDDFGYMYSETTGVHHTSDGTLYDLNVSSNLEPDHQKEILADAFGVDPGNVLGSDEAGQDPRIRRMVAFSKWRSSWDPHASKADPNLN